MPSVFTELPHEVALEENLFIPLPDGTRLAAKLWRPKGTGWYPANLKYRPYRKHDGTRGREQGMHMDLAGHGYACLRVAIRGCGESEGVIDDECSKVELADGCEVIAWIAGQGWCDGQVTMIGISWGGFNGLQIAARHPPAQRTVIAVGSTDDRHATNVHCIGGCLSKGNLDWSWTMVAGMDLPPDPALHGTAWRNLWLQRIAGNRPGGLTWMRHQRRYDYWRHGSVCEDIAAIRVPVYSVSGWADNYSEPVPRLLARIAASCRGLIGPWAHSFPQDVTVEPAIGRLQEVQRWCDRWMKGVATGIMEEPALRVWMQDRVPPRTRYRMRPGRWVGEEAWPALRIRDWRLHAVGGGLHEAPGAGEVGRYGDDADCPTDQREDDAGSLVWVTEPLAGREEILGAPKLRLRVALDRLLALVEVRLNDVAPDGASTRVTVGHSNLTHGQGHDRPQALVPGEAVEVELDDIARGFPAGHRIGHSVSSTCWPIAWPSPEATLTLDLGATVPTLPVRPPRDADAALRPFDPPEAAPETPVIHQTSPQPHLRRVTRDLLSGRSTVNSPRWTCDHGMTDIGIRQRSTGHARYEILSGPLRAKMESAYRVEHIRADGVFVHGSGGTMTCDLTHFHVEAEVVIQKTRQEIHRQQWKEAIPRDCI